MATDKTHGVAGALSDQVARDQADGPPADDAEQLELDPFADAPLLGDVLNSEKRPVERARGRPRGARNKRTKEWADFILARHRSPLLGLAEIVSTPIPQLKTALKCDTLEAAEFWRKCANDLAGYVHQKQPIAIEVDERSAGLLWIVNHDPSGVAAENARDLEGLGLPLVLTKGEEYQDVSKPGDEKSDGGKSDGDAK